MSFSVDNFWMYILGVSVPCPAFVLRQAINLACFLFAQTARAKLIAFCDDQTLEPGPWKGEIYIVNVTRSRYAPWNEPQKEIPLKIGH